MSEVRDGGSGGGGGNEGGAADQRSSVYFRPPFSILTAFILKINNEPFHKRAGESEIS